MNTIGHHSIPQSAIAWWQVTCLTCQLGFVRGLEQMQSLIKDWTLNVYSIDFEMVTITIFSPRFGQARRFFCETDVEE